MEADPYENQGATRNRNLGMRARHRAGRRRPQRIGEEIELYCNPFVEVYGRFSRWLRLSFWRECMRIARFLAELEENILWRDMINVVNHTVW